MKCGHYLLASTNKSEISALLNALRFDFFLLLCDSIKKKKKPPIFIEFVVSLLELASQNGICVTDGVNLGYHLMLV